MECLVEVAGKRLGTHAYYIDTQPDFIYNVNRKQLNGCKYLKCMVSSCSYSGHFKEDVLASFATGDERGILITKNPHTHVGNPVHLANLLLREATRNRARRNNDRLRDIYDEECLNYPAADLMYASLEKNMSQNRRRCMGIAPRTIEELVTYLQTPDCRHSVTLGRGVFFRTSQNLGDAGHNMVFVSPAVEVIIGERARLHGQVYAHVDSTFKVVPSILYQLCTVHIIVNDRSFPVVYALMTRKTQPAYYALFEWVRNDLGVTPDHIMTDYETAMQQGLRAVYPAATISGCFFHFAQALGRRVQKLGMTTLYRERPEVSASVKRCMALALLPAAKIADGLGFIQDQVEATEDGETIIIFNRFLSYIRRQWMERVTPEIFSVAGLPHRTNNHLESFHAGLKRKFREPHPPVLRFLDVLQRVEHASARDCIAANDGQATSRRGKEKYLVQDARIKTSTRLLLLERKTVGDFLNDVRHLVRNFDEGVLPEAEEEDDELINAAAATLPAALVAIAPPLLPAALVDVAPPEPAAALEAGVPPPPAAALVAVAPPPAAALVAVEPALPPPLVAALVTVGPPPPAAMEGLEEVDDDFLPDINNHLQAVNYAFADMEDFPENDGQAALPGEEPNHPPRICCVCREEHPGPQALLLPCGHLRVCRNCIENIVAVDIAAGRPPRCPECRNEFVRIFYPFMN